MVTPSNGYSKKYIQRQPMHLTPAIHMAEWKTKYVILKQDFNVFRMVLWASNAGTGSKAWQTSSLAEVNEHRYALAGTLQMRLHVYVLCCCFLLLIHFAYGNSKTDAYIINKNRWGKNTMDQEIQI